MPKRAGEMHAIHCLYIFLFILVFSSSNGTSNALDDALEKRQLDCKLSLGVVVDYTSLAGKKEKLALEMALKDFYGRRTSLRLNVTLHVRNSRGDPIGAASSVVACWVLVFRGATGFSKRMGFVVVEVCRMQRTQMVAPILPQASCVHPAKTLIKKHHARAIIGFRAWQEAVFVAQLGNESQVPIVSLSNEVPPWAFSQWPFLGSAARNVHAQMKAVAAIIQSWQWRQVNIIYEDFNPVASGINPNIITAIQEVDAKINELVAFSPFSPYAYISKKLESLKNGQCRVFIVHTSITLATKIFKEANEMGMMGKDFVWITTNDITSQIDSLNASSITSIQGVLGVKSYFSTSNKGSKDFQSRFEDMFRSQYPNGLLPKPGASTLQAYDAAWAVALAHAAYLKSSGCVDKWNGQELLEKLLKTKFEGLTGLFSFSTEWKLAPIHIFQIVNVAGKSYRKLGYWTEGLGFSKSIHKPSIYNKSMNLLGQVIWPGSPWSMPKGWAIPTNHSHRLKIGVPTGSTFREFVNVTNDHHGGNPIINGFSIEVFKSTLALLPYHLPYDFIPFDGTYDSLVEQVHIKHFDAVVGDIAIVSNRCEDAEFSQPYAESGLQRNHHPNFRGSVRNQIGTMLSLSFTTLFSLHGEKLHSNLSRMAMAVWLFVALVITQSFTASLTSLLTVQRIDPKKVDVETLIKSGAKVGCDANSFVVKYLEVVVGFDPNNIKRMRTEDDYPQALMSGEIAAAFVEVPYVKMYLAKYCDGFTTSGPTFKVGGFGFAFARSSPYLPDISKAVLKVSESGKLQELECSLNSSFNCSTAQLVYNHDSLGINSFWGLFVITGGTSTIALLIFIFHYVWERWYQPSCDEQQHHNPANDELLMFRPEMENQYQPYL
ncbi:glutamate receptor 2.8-like [Corylus avellana]|uniref:glutamate receptor 2.8-like n=1 Tax=Corylus avellana TaxID=13451 RepID=UPI00286B8F21|nr:glutamate receptor 2.8-like [Corylus avellana]